LQKIGAQPLAALLLLGVYGVWRSNKSDRSDVSHRTYQKAAA
jgi:hypothetical protein